jgi:hypothetical protein
VPEQPDAEGDDAAQELDDVVEELDDVRGSRRSRGWLR